MKTFFIFMVMAMAYAFSAAAQSPLNYPAARASALALPSSVASDSQVLYMTGGLAVGNSNLTFDGSVLSVGSSLRIGSPASPGNNRFVLRQVTEGSGRGIALYNSANGANNLQMYVDTDGGIKFSYGGSPRIVFDQSSRVGVLTSSPSATLHVGASGTLILQPQGSSPITCNTTAKGAMAMTSTTTELCFCNGTSWLQVDSGSACSW